MRHKLTVKGIVQYEWKLLYEYLINSVRDALLAVIYYHQPKGGSPNTEQIKMYCY